jgi:pyridoxal phosphate enzyme (YggS family)
MGIGVEGLVGRAVSAIAARLRDVRSQIEATARKAGRDPDSVKLVAVTKMVKIDQIQEATQAGVVAFGENYVQEALKKIGEVKSVREWHFIGHLQSNKVKYVLGIFDLIHSVDRLSLAEQIQKRAEQKGLTQQILIQVNISGEESKSGVERDKALSLVTRIKDFPGITLRGLMTMPPYFDDPEKSRPYFRILREIRDEAEQKCRVSLPELSMGMSGDYQVAIEEGATIVRIGTAIFGPRN